MVIDRGLEFDTATGAAAIVQCENDVAVLCQVLTEQLLVRARPRTLHHLDAGSAVNIHEHRILFTRDQIARLGDLVVERLTVAGFKTAKLGGDVFRQVGGVRVIRRHLVRDEGRECLAIRRAERHGGWAVGRRERVEEYLRVFRHGDDVPADVGRNPLWCWMRIVQGDGIEMPLQGRLDVRHEVEKTALFVHTRDGPGRFAIAGDLPVAAGERPDQVAVEVVQVQMFEARAARGPDEAGRVIEERQLVVEIDPRVAVLAQQLGGLSRGGIDLQQCQCLLVAALALHGEAGAAGQPVHAREIDVGVRTEIDLQRRRADARPHPAAVRTVAQWHCGRLRPGNVA